MPIPYNRDFTPYKSAQLQALDCRPTGQTKTVGAPGELWKASAIFTAAEAIEVGECVSMVRVPKGLFITDVILYHTANADATIGVGDHYCCGRFLGPILTNQASGANLTLQPQGTTCSVINRLAKINRSGDGCGFGYTYTCDTDIVVTNGYGINTFQQGGGSVSGTSVGTGTSGVLAAGTVLGLTVEGFVVPNPNT